MHPYLMKSGTELAARIRRGDMSSFEVVKLHLDHIIAANPKINAVVETRRSDALAEARAADATLADVGPEAVGAFHGVPCTIKESFELEGTHHSAGLVARRDVISDKDAPTVARLRAAGAIPIGCTNVSELLMWLESNNRVYGRSNNPYDQSRIVGGSSGGEGASVSSGMAPFGLGADIGGSIRMPAFFNGVFGHKPSSGLIPNTGQFPIAENEARSYLCTGPIARRAEDLWPLVTIMAGPDGECHACREMELRDPSGVSIEELRVFSVPDNGRTSVHDDLRDAQRAAGDALRVLGAKVVQRRFPALRQSFELWSAAMSAAGGTSFGELLGEGTRIPVGKELAKWAIGRSPHTLPALLLAAIEKVPEALPDQSGKLLVKLDALREELSELLGDDGVLLYPSFSRPAPRHYLPMLRPFDMAYNGIWNVVGFPSTQVPLGLDGRGLPLGIQVVAAHGNDHLSVAVASALEKWFGGWVPPPSL